MILQFLAMLTATVATGPAAIPGDADATLRDNNAWWSLQPMVKALPPPMPAGGQNAIDAWIGATLAKNGLAPAPEADARTLMRRLSFDLTGLPPTPVEVDEFIRAWAATSDRAAVYTRLVDSLLASPRYGERWARHWLDVVHYGETHGYDKDQPRPHAWPYRDYVIRAFNQDKPYTRFVQEQVAGDALFPGTVDGITALGFIAAGPWDLIGHAEVPESKIDGKVARHLDRDDMVTNTMSTFNALTVHCAQCHDHKFDPITAEDYYSLQSVFAALDRADRTYDEDPAVATRRETLTTQQRDLKRRVDNAVATARERSGEALASLEKTIADLDRQFPGALPAATDALVQARDHVRQARRLVLKAMLGSDAWEAMEASENELATLEKGLQALPAPKIVFAGTIHHGSGAFAGTGGAGGRPRPVTVLARGDVRHPGREVTPGGITAIAALPASFNLPPGAAEGDRRAALARWLTDPAHPLTWRTIVNRVWHYHFGRGIVDTPNDFGRMGGEPSHPELLDWLAVTFRDDFSGSLKQLHRLIVTSAAYRQQSGVVNETAARVDSGNALLWRQNRRKLEAEAIRDSVLAVAGKLDLTMGGPSFQDFVVTRPEHSPHYEYHLADPENPALHRRSVYRFLVRSQQQPWMAALDCADPSMMVEKRNQTITPLQALAQLNNQLMVVMARHFAQRAAQAGPGMEAQITAAFRLAVQREPRPEERSALVDYASTHGLANACRLLINLNEFTFVD